MALSKVGGGYQVADGNTNEVTFYGRGQAVVIAAAHTITAATLSSGIIAATSSGSYAITTPTGAELDAILTNAQIGSSFDLAITHGSATNVLTLTAGATGVTIVGLATVTGITSGSFTFRRTGVATWSVYRL